MKKERDINKFVIISIVAVAILVISLISTIIGRNARKARENTFAGEMSSLNKKLSESESVSTKIGKTVEESEENEENLGEFETAELIKNEKSEEEKNSKVDIKKTDKKVNKEVEKKKASKKEDKVENETSVASSVSSEDVIKNDRIDFEAPVKGEILREFAKDSLVFSNTLQEWITHNGIDIKADKTTVVKSAANGTVSAIKNDPRYGLTVIINHDNGYQTIYSNLLTSEFVTKGEKVEKGQSIGTIGNSASFEVSDEYHLHFELIRNNEYLDPVIYMNFE